MTFPDEFNDELKQIDDVARSFGAKYGFPPNHGDVVAAFRIWASNKLWRHVFVNAARGARRRLYIWYLLSSAWQRKRHEAMKAASGHCQLCRLWTGMLICREATQVHHLTYARLGDESPEDLQAVCDECHRKEHGKSPRGRKHA